jgi:hypothetical protein
MKILLPIDGSADALQAVRVALQWVAEGLKAEFVLVNVQDPASLYEMVVTHDVERLAQLRAEAGADLLRPAEALLQAAGQSVRERSGRWLASGAAAGAGRELRLYRGADGRTRRGVSRGHRPWRSGGRYAALQRMARGHRALSGRRACFRG